jgi:hypothetical protein
MAFNANNLVRWAPTGLSDANTLLENPLPIAPPPLLPQLWGYQAGNDSISTVEASGYFNYPANFTNFPGSFLQKGDTIYCVCSNGNVQLAVLTLNPITTTAAVTGFLSTTLTNGDIFVGNASNVATGVAMSGDVAITNAGVTTIQPGVVTGSKIAAATVGLSNLTSTVAPEAIIKYSAQYTTVGGAAAEAITVTGALSTDLAFVQLVNHGPNTVSVAFAVMTANTLTVTFSANPGTGAIINYQITRVAS